MVGTLRGVAIALSLSLAAWKDRWFGSSTAAADRSAVRVALMHDDDLMEVAALDRQANRYPWTVVRHREYRAVCEEQMRGGLIRIGREIAGFIIYQVRNKGYIVRKLVVAPAHRRRGLGTVLIEHVEAMAVASGEPGMPPRLSTSIPEYQLVGQLFFKQRGWTCVGINRNYLGDGVSWYVFGLIPGEETDVADALKRYFTVREFTNRS